MAVCDVSRQIPYPLDTTSSSTARTPSGDSFPTPRNQRPDRGTAPMNRVTIDGGIMEYVRGRRTLRLVHVQDVLLVRADMVDDEVDPHRHYGGDT